MIILEDRVLLHQQDGSRIPVDPREIFLFEADGGETLVRTRHSQPLTDVRQLSELMVAFEPLGFAQIHRSWAVNLRRVREIRPIGCQALGSWEVGTSVSSQGGGAATKAEPGRRKFPTQINARKPCI